MSILFSTAASGAQKSTSPITIPLVKASNAVVLVTVGVKPTTASVTSITDLGSNSYTLTTNLDGGATFRSELWVTTGANASTGITVTFTGTPTASVANAVAYTGVDHAATSGIKSTSGTNATPTITFTVGTSNWLMGGHQVTGLPTVTASIGVLRSSEDSSGGSGGTNIEGFAYDNSTGGALTITASQSASAQWVVIAQELIASTATGFFHHRRSSLLLTGIGI